MILWKGWLQLSTAEYHSIDLGKDFNNGQIVDKKSKATKPDAYGVIQDQSANIW